MPPLDPPSFVTVSHNAPLMAHQHLPSPLPVSRPTRTTNDHNPTGWNYYQTIALDGGPLLGCPQPASSETKGYPFWLELRWCFLAIGETTVRWPSPSTITTTTTNHMGGGHCQGLANLLHHSPGLGGYHSMRWHSIAREIWLMRWIVLINDVLLHVPCLYLLTFLCCLSPSS